MTWRQGRTLVPADVQEKYTLGAKTFKTNIKFLTTKKNTMHAQL